MAEHPSAARVAAAPGVRFTPEALALRAARRLVAALRAPFRVLDPACGDGALLCAVWRAADAPRSLAREGLFGIELDPERAERARARLRATIGGEDGERAAQRIVCADALDPDVRWPEGSHVLANPPWVSFSGRQRAPLDAARQARYARWWPACAAWPSLHGAFLERSACHLHAERTRAVLLLPRSVGHLERYGELRRAVVARTELVGVPDELGEDAFPGVCEPSSLFELRGRAERVEGTRAPWSLPACAASRALLEHLRGLAPLPPACFRDFGVHTGNARAALLVAPGSAGAGRGSGASPVSGLAPVREGRDLAPYRLAPPRLSLRTDLARSAELRFRIGPRESYRSVPVLVRQTADRPIAALHTAPSYFRNSLLACTPPPELDPAFVVAVLNSELAALWHRTHFADAHQRSFPQVKVAHLRSLPFPLANRAVRARQRAIADAARELTDRVSADDPRLARLSELVTRAYGLSPADLPG